MANYNIYRSPALPRPLPTTPGYGNPIPVPRGYGQRVPTDAAPTYGQYQPAQAQSPPPLYGGGILSGNHTVTQPSYGGISGINDPTLAAGASYSGGGGGGSLPPGAIPYDPFAGGNANVMYARGYRKKLINGQWAWIPPAQPGTQAPASYFPT